MAQHRSPFPPPRSTLPVVTDGDFKSVIRKGLVAVSFKASWCGYCKVAAPVIEAEAKKHAAIRTYQLDASNGSSAADGLDVKELPSVIFFRDGKEIGRTVGSNSADIAKGFDALSKKAK